MKKLPIKTESAVVLRTEFSDEAVWKEICAAIQEPVDDFTADVEFVDDASYQGVTKDKLLKLIPKDYGHPFVIVADATAIADPDRPLLVIDLFDKPGRGFRALPSEIQSIQNNLSEANMDFEEFAEAVDESGVFRGFPEM